MGNPKTFEQAAHLLQLAGDKNMSLEQLQLLYSLGLLSDLFEAASVLDLTRINREDYKRILGFDPSVFRVRIGGSETTDEIISGFGFPADDLITQANFPLQPRAAVEEDEIEIIDPGCSFSEDQGLKFLADAELGRPTYELALRFAEQHGKATTSGRKPFVIFLHEAWQDPRRCRRVLCLNRYARYRGLYLCCPGHGFGDGCVLAGVRPRK